MHLTFTNSNLEVNSGLPNTKLLSNRGRGEESLGHSSSMTVMAELELQRTPLQVNYLFR